MAIATATLRQAVANAYGANAPYAALQTTAKTGSTAGTEVTGGTYARKALTWSAGTGGVITATAVFDVPAGVSVQSSAIYSAVTAGTFLDDYTVAYNSQPSAGQLTVNYTQTIS
jgi:hypothetical protein